MLPTEKYYKDYFNNKKIKFYLRVHGIFFRIIVHTFGIANAIEILKYTE